MPGISRAECDAARAALRGHPTPIDQVQLRAVKDSLLLRSYQHFQTETDSALRNHYQEFVDLQRDWLNDYAIFRALKDKFDGAGWECWPPALKNREPKALAETATELADRIAMFKYMQFLAHHQWQQMRKCLQQAGVLLGGDLAFSPCRESVEVWAHPELFDPSRSVGAPPDEFSSIGQRWGLPMPDWRQMRAHNFDFLRMRVRHARELYDVLRIDHVVGLYRTYGYPVDDEVGGEFDPAGEAAQQAQGEEIMRVVKEEAGAMQIVAEDLGLIPRFVRDSLAALAIPGYKVLRWEKQADNRRFIDPVDYPSVSLATTGTHDTDTLAEWWATLGQAERELLMKEANLPAETDCGSPILDERSLDAILEWLYGSPAQLVITPIQDLFGWDARINLPGTIADTNWSWRLPFDIETGMQNPQILQRISKLREICEKTGRFEPNCD